jgi:competence protein ComFC
MIFRCILCKDASFSVICKKCKKEYLDIKLIKNKNVYSFYDYDIMEIFNGYKFKKRGDLVYKELAFSFKNLAKILKFKAFIVPVDDTPKSFSHTAVLAQAMKTKFLTPLFNVLKATSNVKYAGKSLEFRLKNPRNFKYNGPKNIDVILVDDIKTTGLTLKEAEEVLAKNSVNVLFSVVLSDKSIR